jgi:hypothetical protein
LGAAILAKCQTSVGAATTNADGGTISLNGLYAAPLKTGVYHLMVSRDDFPALSAVVEVTAYSAVINFAANIKRAREPLRTLFLKLSQTFTVN